MLYTLQQYYWQHLYITSELSRYFIICLPVVPLSAEFKSSKPLSSCHVPSKSMLSRQKYLPYLSVRISALVTTLDSWCGICTASITYLKAFAEHKNYNYNPSDAVLPGIKFRKQPLYRQLSTFDRAVVFAGIVAFEQLFQIPSWYFDTQPHACALFKTTNKFAVSCRNITKSKHYRNQQLTQRHRRHVCKYRVTSQSICTVTDTWAPKYRHW